MCVCSGMYITVYSHQYILNRCLCIKVNNHHRVLLILLMHPYWQESNKLLTEISLLVLELAWPTCERQCGAAHSCCSITSLTHIATIIIGYPKVINHKWWGRRHLSIITGTPDTNVGRIIDKSHSIFCPGDTRSCCGWVNSAVKPDHRLWCNVVDPAVV